MPSFSEMFPSYAGFFSKIGRWVVPPRTRTAAEPVQDPATPEPTVDSPAGEIDGSDESILTTLEGASEAVSELTSIAPAPVSPPPAAPSRVLSAEETQILQMYQSWVELDSGVAQAHEDLQRILNSRGKAAVLRNQAQETMDQAEVVREEAQRIGDAAWRAFDRGFATNITGFANRRAMVREIDQSRRTQAELQRSVHKNAWEEAERSREAATEQVLKALNALTVVADQVEKELAEAAGLPKLADALQDAARDELQCAEAVKDELLHLGREALNQLGVTPTSDHEYVLVEPPATGSGTLEPGDQGLILGDGGAGFETGPQPVAEETPSLEQTVDQPQVVSDSLSWEAESTEAPVKVRVEDPIEAEVVAEMPEDVPENASGATESGDAMEIAPEPPGGETPLIIDVTPSIADTAAAPLEETVVEEPPAMESQPVAPPPDQPTTPDPVVSEPAAAPAPEFPTAAPASSAQDLLREMEEARAFVESSQSSAAAVPEPVTPESPPPQSPIEAATPEPSRPAEASPSAAEQLIRDMESARAAMQPLQQSPPSEAPQVAQDLIRDMQAIRSAPAEVQPESDTPPANVPTPAPVDPDSPVPIGQDAAPQGLLDSAPKPAAPPPADSAGTPAEASYSGRLSLMFPSSLTQDEMGMVWEALEDVARGSQILDSRLLSASEGIQFTVDLGAAGLVVQDLGSRLMGAEIEGLEPDRLKVNWPKR